MRVESIDVETTIESVAPPVAAYEATINDNNKPNREKLQTFLVYFSLQTTVRQSHCCRQLFNVILVTRVAGKDPFFEGAAFSLRFPPPTHKRLVT